MITMKRWQLYAMLWGALLIGQFILPLAWRAMAQGNVTLDMTKSFDVIVLNGVGPDGKMAPIRVDGSGHVICSKE